MSGPAHRRHVQNSSYSDTDVVSSDGGLETEGSGLDSGHKTENRRRVAVDHPSRPSLLSGRTKLLCVLFVALFYVSFFEATKPNWYLSPWTWIDSTIFFITMASFPFPVFRPCIYVLCVAYEIVLLWAIRQDLPRLRSYLHNQTSNPMLEMSYDNDCELYHPSNPAHVITAVWTKMDNFVWFHIVGYVFKFLLVRSWWMCHALSVAFELAEYSFEHHLPNFKECWWDHWIMDALLTNTIGIWIGMKIVYFCDLQRYQWRRVIRSTGRRENVSNTRSIERRIKFWRPPLIQLQNFGVVALMIIFIIMSEVNTFYMKFLLWIPPEHPFNVMRLVITLAAGVPAIHEAYFKLQGKPRKFTFTVQSVCACTVLLTELATYLYLGSHEFLVPFPSHVQQLWAGILLVSVLWATWHFFLRYVIYGYDKEEELFLQYLERVEREKRRRAL